MDSKIIERVRRLLALSKSDNVHEAGAAAAKAQALMTEHRIAMADVAISENAVVEPIDTTIIDSSGKRIVWKHVLADSLGTANSAIMFTSFNRDTQRSEYKVVGTPSAAQTVQYLYAYLVREIERLCAAEKAANGAAWANSFKLGAASEVGKRLTAAADAAKAAAKGAGHGAALVRIDDDLARARRSLAASGLRTRTERPRMSSSDGFASGKVAGQSIPLGGSPQLGRGAAGDLRG